MYLYPENLTARPMLWLWTLRDVAFIGIGLLLSALALTQAGTVVPLVVTAALAFLCIRHGGVSMLDFLRYAAAFFFFGQQYYEPSLLSAQGRGGRQSRYPRSAGTGPAASGRCADHDGFLAAVLLCAAAQKDGWRYQFHHGGAAAP